MKQTLVTVTRLDPSNSFRAFRCSIYLSKGEGTSPLILCNSAGPSHQAGASPLACQTGLNTKLHELRKHGHRMLHYTQHCHDMNWMCFTLLSPFSLPGPISSPKNPPMAVSQRVRSFVRFAEFTRPGSPSSSSSAPVGSTERPARRRGPTRFAYRRKMPNESTLEEGNGLISCGFCVFFYMQCT